MSDNNKDLKPKSENDQKIDPSNHKITPLPSMFQMLRSFSKELVNYVKEGAPNVTTEDYADRLDVCNNCPNIIKQSMRCRLCGCAMQHKAKWKTSVCPDNPQRWEPQIVRDQNGDIISQETLDQYSKARNKIHNEQRQKDNNTDTGN